MQPINKFLEEQLGARPAPEPMERPIRVKKKFEKVPGESKAERRLRRRAAQRG